MECWRTKDTCERQLLKVDHNDDLGDGSRELPRRAKSSNQRRSPHFHFDSLVRLTALRISEQGELWRRSTDLRQHGIGVTVAGNLIRDELDSLQIPLPKAKIVSVNASVRYCEQGHCGVEFMELLNTQREAIHAACEKLRKGSDHI